jgi:hypothetical protein
VVTEKYKKTLMWLKPFIQGKRVLHIGCHKGQEGNLYKEFTEDFTFVEPIPKFHKLLLSKGYKSLNIAITDYEGTKDFFMTTKSQRASLKEPDKSVATISKKISVTCKPLKAIQGDFNCLVVDAQGETFNILNSGLLTFDTIVCEVSTNPRYKGESHRTVVEDYLRDNGYVFVDEYRHKDKDIYDIVYKKN